MSSTLDEGVTGFASLLGLSLTHADGSLVTGTIDVQPSLHQPYGIVHGGVYCSVVETVASVGAALWFEGRGNVVGVSNSTNFLRATRQGRLDVRATPIKQGRTQQLWNVDISDEQQRLVATGQVRIANVADADALGQAARRPSGQPS